MSPLSKIFWMKHEQSDIYKQTAMFADIKTYIFYQLFEKYVIDYSMASATGMFNLEKLDWDKEALELMGITEAQLPQLVPTTHILKGMKKRYATLMGIDENTPIIVGASDGVLSNLGVNSYKKAKSLSQSVHLARFEQSLINLAPIIRTYLLLRTRRRSLCHWWTSE